MTDWPVLVLPALLAAGLVLIGLGMAGRRRPPRRRRPGIRLAGWLAQAGIAGARPERVAVACAAPALLAAALLLALTGSAWVALAFALLSGYLPVLALRARQRRRGRELQAVWPDAIDNLASGVRAGLALPEAVAGLAERGPQALRPAFARFAADYHATGRFGAALDGLKDELADPTADRVVEALRIAREVGGTELGRILRTLANFLRDEYRVRKELEARQAWVVVAARLAFATPWLVLLMLSSKREAVAAYRGPGGAAVLAAGAVMATAGYRLMLRMGRIPDEQRVLG
ncbi:MAG TPA: type II secretion system F family protein [Actinomycetes bacterium]